MLSRIESDPADKSHDIDSDAETELAVWSPPESPIPSVPRDHLAEAEEVSNFSLTARKGSSSNASPLRLSGAAAPTFGNLHSTPSIQRLPTRAQREIRRLQSHNAPGLRENEFPRTRTRRRVLNLREYDTDDDNHDRDDDDGSGRRRDSE